MVRISGIQLPNNKRVEIGLTYVYGIGRSLSNKILHKLNINTDIKIKDLTEEQENLLREEIKKMPTEGDLKRKVVLDIKRLQDIGSYRGYRHKAGLPTRGQRTRYNSRTRKGKKKIVIGGSKATK
ncbi:30S ribosomal protein S13 [Candidatus Peregrinibacteria bacterium CG08_land_8_20_14_0_20_41_10]|nr:MAG: 30S ribosomal protein S13 [Candidatus Peregrinibacteria bacterium CG1_02_41_10]PIS32219.1 MAG: 30S ribosomal protein S13 [Candidatus Peregrinibacteria bacterium CG08_land_8_20_14_0_20_41_10]